MNDVKAVEGEVTRRTVFSLAGALAAFGIVLGVRSSVANAQETKGEEEEKKGIEEEKKGMEEERKGMEEEGEKK